ncbi:MAG: AMP-binding protein, partial [Saprospiraceae bacterium]
MKILQPSQEIGKVIPNIATMLRQNAKRFGTKTVYQERKGAQYEGISWNRFYENIQNIAWQLRTLGFGKGNKMVLFSENRLEMLELALAVMASGGIAVPIFYNFYPETAELLIRHSDAEFLAVSGNVQLNRIDPGLPLKKIITLDNLAGERFNNLVTFESLLGKMPEDGESPLHFDAKSNDICLNMYTSGTMGVPKCVQLTHRNILSQQAALRILWNLGENDRFLSYLPWHHSFGGIFELFTALSNGATYSLESSFGKVPKVIMENWLLINPTVFFSVPKVYEALVELTRESKEAEDAFFNSGLKFVFTAAAPLPEKISDEFERRSIPVIEGWGLTETSPCCTLTDPALKRQPGVVGKPIPGVSVRIDEESEIQVKGPNVMVGYYKNDEANAEAVAATVTAAER